MEGPWVVAFLFLWLIVLLELALILAMARYVGGFLQQANAFATGARVMADGPDIDRPAPRFQLSDVGGITHAPIEGKGTMLVFMSTHCPSCKALVPNLRRIWRTERPATEMILLFADLEREEVPRFLSENRLDDIPFVISSRTVSDYRIGTLPYVVIIDESGLVRTKGLVNNGVHLDSLLNAVDTWHQGIESRLRFAK